MKRVLTVAILAIVAMVSLTACKATEPFQDAPVTGPNDKTPASVYSMPDGFSNFAEKCDGHGFRVFVIFHSDGSYGAITAMRDDTC